MFLCSIWNVDVWAKMLCLIDPKPINSFNKDSPWRTETYSLKWQLPESWRNSFMIHYFHCYFHVCSQYLLEWCRSQQIPDSWLKITVIHHFIVFSIYFHQLQWITSHIIMCLFEWISQKDLPYAWEIESIYKNENHQFWRHSSNC